MLPLAGTARKGMRTVVAELLEATAHEAKKLSAGLTLAHAANGAAQSSHHW